MPYFTKEQIAKAKEIDLLTYLKKCDPDELVYESRNSYTTKTHDSLKISNGLWNWFSRNIGGKTALEYLIQVKGFSFTDAVSHLINQKGLEKKVYVKKVLTEKEKIERFILPEKAESNDKIFSYLRGRGISKDIIDECINKGLIYQEKKYNNVVFVGYDEKNRARYASLRGITATRFLGEAYCSDKSYSFRLNSVVKNNTVHLFECAIDLLSYATFKEINNAKWDEENLLSLSGVYKPSKDINNSKPPTTLVRYLKNHPNIDTIILHLDNDYTGRQATKAITFSFSDRYKVIDNPPRIGKDYNQFLCMYLGINDKNRNESCR